MSVIADFNRFFQSMTYGYDRGVESVRLTPSMFDRLFAEIHGLIKPTKFDEKIHDWRNYLPSPIPRHLEMNGVMIIRGD